MPTYRPYTQIGELPANSQGEITVLTQHLDRNFSTIADALEAMLLAIFSTGGVVVEGTVSNPEDAIVRVEGRVAITDDARAAVIVGEQEVDLDPIATDTKCRVVIRAAEGEVVETNFVDADTGEALTHAMMSYLGRLEIREGDATDYPAIGPADAYVAKVTRTAGGVTIDEVENPPPTPRGWFDFT